MSAFNGPGHQLREEGDERQEPNEAPLGLDGALVGVDGVAHRLKCVEGNADGQNDLGKQPVVRGAEETQDAVGIRDKIKQVVSKAQLVQKTIEVGGDEAGVFEIGEKAEVTDEADDQPQLARARVALHEEHHVIVDRRGAEKKQEIPGVPPAVKRVGGDQEPDIHELVVAAHQQENRVHDQKKDEEHPGVKKHGGRLSLIA